MKFIYYFLHAQKHVSTNVLSHKKINSLMLTCLISVLWFSGCKKDEDTKELPQIKTIQASAITDSSATSCGIILSNGGDAIIESGIYWSANPDPSLTGFKATIESAKDTFSCKLSNLQPDKTYYVRAFATNSVGTSYGDEISFKTLKPVSNSIIIASVDSAIKQVMHLRNIPAVSIAIVKDEKLVYVKSYGYADKEASVPASTNRLFRIASVSKSFTAIAILKLVQDSRITLDQTVFGTNGILGNDYGVPPSGSNKELITVRHLLDHTSGWRNKPNDPMFSNLAYSKSQLLTDMVLNRPLVTVPGADNSYLNFGYFVLGRIIEKVSAMTYENYVKLNILQPCGITDMQIAGNTQAEKFPNEVKYYPASATPYAMNIKRADACGGWIASAKDLACFIVRVDRNVAKSDLISEPLLNQFNFGFARWAVTGSLPGTSAVLSRVNKTFSFAIIANTRIENDADAINEDLKAAINKQIETITNWPAQDLF